jgi:hypothetical protein
VNRPEILPETKVGALLQAYPQLEDELIAIAPRFTALRNPVLRRTVARITTLAQAAVAEIPTRELVDRLRSSNEHCPLLSAATALSTGVQRFAMVTACCSDPSPQSP